jgi:hypothetical protein
MQLSSDSTENPCLVVPQNCFWNLKNFTGKFMLYVRIACFLVARQCVRLRKYFITFCAYKTIAIYIGLNIINKTKMIFIQINIHTRILFYRTLNASSLITFINRVHVNGHRKMFLDQTQFSRVNPAKILTSLAGFLNITLEAGCSRTL